jgi:hypothetical protein
MEGGHRVIPFRNRGGYATHGNLGLCGNELYIVPTAIPFELIENTLIAEHKLLPHVEFVKGRIYQDVDGRKFADLRSIAFAPTEIALRVAKAFRMSDARNFYGPYVLRINGVVVGNISSLVRRLRDDIVYGN